MDLALSRRICGSIFYFRAVKANVRQVFKVHACMYKSIPKNQFPDNLVPALALFIFKYV